MAEINIDATLVKNDIQLSQTDEKLVEMSNGCICCTLREDLLVEVKKLVTSGNYDAIVIESTGISEPIPVAQTFSYIDEETGIDLTQFAYLDTAVTVVDAANFLRDFTGSDNLRDRWMGTDETDTRNIVNLLTDQIEFCDVLIVNKIDDISDEDKIVLRKVLKWLQPTAKYIETNYGTVDFDAIVDTGLFDFDTASQSAGWIQEYHNPHGHTPETEAYGITSFVYKRERPFHPERFFDIARIGLPWVIRSKWFFRLVSNPIIGGNWSQAGWSIKVAGAWRWLVSFTDQERKELWCADAWNAFVDNPYGDRRTEIVIIGIDYDRVYLEKLLDAALVTDQEREQDPSDFVDSFQSYMVW